MSVPEESNTWVRTKLSLLVSTFNVEVRDRLLPLHFRGQARRRGVPGRACCGAVPGRACCGGAPGQAEADRGGVTVPGRRPVQGAADAAPAHRDVGGQ